MRQKSFILFFLLLGSCEVVTNDLDYSDNEQLEEYELEYPDRFINWNDAFSQNLDEYYIYVFSYDCFYCKEVKKDIIGFCLSNDVFLIEYKKEIPIDYKIENTIGVESIENLFIRGTPTLIFISRGKVEMNIAGKNRILEIIDLNKNQ